MSKLSSIFCRHIFILGYLEQALSTFSSIDIFVCRSFFCRLFCVDQNMEKNEGRRQKISRDSTNNVLLQNHVFCNFLWYRFTVQKVWLWFPNIWLTLHYIPVILTWNLFESTAYSSGSQLGCCDTLGCPVKSPPMPELDIYCIYY